MNFKLSYVFLALALLLVVTSIYLLAWHYKNDGYNMVCGTRIDITYESPQRKAGTLAGEFALHLQKISKVR